RRKESEELFDEAMTWKMATGNHNREQPAFKSAYPISYDLGSILHWHSVGEYRGRCPICNLCWLEKWRLFSDYNCENPSWLEHSIDGFTGDPIDNVCSDEVRKMNNVLKYRQVEFELDDRGRLRGSEAMPVEGLLFDLKEENPDLYAQLVGDGDS